MIPFVVEDIEKVPEPLREHYKKGEDGKFVLEIQGDIPGLVAESQLTEANTRLKDFRTNNTNLNTTVEELRKKLEAFKDIDPQDHQKIKEQLEALQKKAGVKNPDDVQSAIEEQVNKALAPLKKSVDELTTTNKTLQSKVETMTIDDQLKSVALKAKVRPTAMEDFVARGKRVFQFKEGQAVPVGSDGFEIKSKKNTNEVLSMEEWAGDLFKEAEHLFESSSGAGSGGKDEPFGGNVTTIANDPEAIGKNLEDIASGKAEVTV